MRVNVTVIGADGQTPLYVGAAGARRRRPTPGFDAAMREAIDLLPPISDISVAVPHGSLLSAGFFVGYGAILLQGLFVYQRGACARRGAGAPRRRRLRARRCRPTARARSRRSSRRCATGCSRSSRPSAPSPAAIRELEQERAAPAEAARARPARGGAAQRRRARGELEQEHQALEDLLEEALEDVGAEGSRDPGAPGPAREATRAKQDRARAGDARARPSAWRDALRTLYKNLDFDERAIDDLDRARRRVAAAARRGGAEAARRRARDRGGAPQGRRPPAAALDLRARLRGQGPHLLHAQRARRLPHRSRSAARRRRSRTWST